MSRRFLALLTVALIVLCSAPVARAQEGDIVLRVGLFYGEGSLATANLQNYTGSGYRLGYFNADNSFTELARTDVIKISMSAGSSSSTAIVVTNTETGTLIYQYDGNLGIMPSLPEAGVERPLTWCKGYYYAGGFEYRRYKSNITVINRVGMEDYAKGVVPYEIGGNAPLESQKAQALCARSYAYNNMNKHASFGFDVCKSTDCQVYDGAKLETESSNAAVDQTRGQYVFYDGAVASTFYHSSNGGATEDVLNVWTNDLPYLRAVSDGFEDLAAAMNGRWSYTLTNAMLTDILNAKGHTNSGIISMKAEYTPAGNIQTLTFVDSNGKIFQFSKEKAKFILNSPTYNISIYSQRFSVNSGQMLSVEGSTGTTTRSDLENITILGANGQTSQASVSTSIITADGEISSVPQTTGDGTYVIQGTGWGHNIGMSQNGAKGMANMGYTYVEIVRYYFKDVYVGSL